MVCCTFPWRGFLCALWGLAVAWAVAARVSRPWIAPLGLFQAIQHWYLKRFLEVSEHTLNRLIIKICYVVKLVASTLIYCNQKKALRKL